MKYHQYLVLVSLGIIFLVVIGTAVMENPLEKFGINITGISGSGHYYSGYSGYHSGYNSGYYSGYSGYSGYVTPPSQTTTTTTTSSGGSSGSGCITTWLNCTTKNDYVNGNVRIAGKYCSAPMKDKPNCTISNINSTLEVVSVQEETPINNTPISTETSKSSNHTLLIVLIIVGLLVFIVLIYWLTSFLKEPKEEDVQ